MIVSISLMCFIVTNLWYHVTVRHHCSVLLLANILGPHIDTIRRVVTRDILLGRPHLFEFFLEREASVDLSQRCGISALQVTSIHIDSVSCNRHEFTSACCLLLVYPLSHHHRLLQRSNGLIWILLVQFRWNALSKWRLFVRTVARFTRRCCNRVVLWNVQRSVNIGTDTSDVIAWSFHLKQACLVCISFNVHVL